MNSSLPRLTVLVLLLALVALFVVNRTGEAVGDARPLPSAPAAPLMSVSHVESNSVRQTSGTSSVGDQLLVQAASRLARRTSVSARLRHQVFLGDRPLFGVGHYWQLGTGADLRVRMTLQFVGQESSLEQVSTTRFLWIDRRLPTGRNVSRIDLRQLRADPILNGGDPDELAPGHATWSSLNPDVLAHCGGLPSMFASLRENFSFLPPQAMRLAAQPVGESQSASVPVYVLVGHWKHERLAALLGKHAPADSATHSPGSLDAGKSSINAIPKRFPQEVLLLLGQADLFPYRIEYRRMETPRTADGDAAAIPYQLSPNPLVVLEFADVAFDGPVAIDEFNYNPGDADWVDQTATVIHRLRRSRQAQLAVRAGNESGVLPAR